MLVVDWFAGIVDLEFVKADDVAVETVDAAGLAEVETVLTDATVGFSGVETGL